MSAIFISHSSGDAVAGEIRDWLAGEGHRSVFLDFDPADGIPAGRDWEQELYRKIRAVPFQALTTACLTVEQRMRYLGESEAEARARYEACDRARGRSTAGRRGG